MTLGVGWALLHARTGGNRPHSHVAHQFSLALEPDCEIGGTYQLEFTQGEAVLIPAGTTHCLAPVGKAIRTVYVDPLFTGVRDLTRERGLIRLSPDEAAALEVVRCGEDARRWVSTYLRHAPFSQIDHRFQAILSEIEPGISPATLAHVVGISTTRLRELAIRDFGVPTTKLPMLKHEQLTVWHPASRRLLLPAAFPTGPFHASLVEWFGVTLSPGSLQLEIW